MNGLQIIVKRDSLDWDDENRLRMIVDNTKSGYYGYDANGERAYKLTGSTEMDTTATGIMTKFINDEGRSWSVPQETVNNIVESNGFYEKSQTLLQKIKSWFE